MKKQLNKKILFILTMFMIFLYLFPINITLADTLPPYTTEDDGTDGPDVSDPSIIWELTTFGPEDLPALSDEEEAALTTNPERGWKEYTDEDDGEKYVVLAGATHELLASDHRLYFFGYKFNHIHYFSYFDTIQFKFEDQSYDSNVYNGIILDSCGASMWPQYEGWKHEDGVQILDVYFGSNEDRERSPGLSGKRVIVTSTGTFSESAGTTSSASNLSVILDALSLFFTTIGDIVQTSIESVAEGINWLDCKQLLYTRQEIEADEELNKEIRVRDARERDKFLDGSTKNVAKRISIPNTETDKSGNETVIYAADTKIPVIAMDMYSLATGESDLFDINFYNANYDSENNHAFWKFIRGIVVTFSKIVMYISAAALLTLLIYRAIMLVFSTVSDNPKTAALSKEVMDDFVKAIALVAGSVIIVAMSTQFYAYLQDIILNGKDTNYIIRLNVEDVYMFDTNIMGYIKYMTLRVSSWSKLGYSIVYALMAIFCNFAIFLTMFLRMLGIGFLVVIAPLTAVGTLSKKSIGGGGIGQLLNFKTWIKTYFTLLLLPLGFIIMYRIILLLW